MKKIFYSLFFLPLILLTGCGEPLIEEDIRDEIIELMSEEEIIDSDWEYVDFVTEYDYFLPPFDETCYKYVYTDENGKYYAIYMDVLRYEKDTEYGNIEMKAERDYYLLSISQCDYGVTTEEYGDGEILEEPYADTYNYDTMSRYMAYYSEFLGIKGKLKIEQITE